MGGSRNLELLQGGSPTAFPIIAIRRADDSATLIQTRSAVGTVAGIEPGRSANDRNRRKLPRFKYVLSRVGNRTDCRIARTYIGFCEPRISDPKVPGTSQGPFGRTVHAGWPIRGRH